MANNYGIDLSKPIAEAKKIYEGVLSNTDTVSTKCILDDTYETVTLYKDYDNPTNTLLENCKTASFSLSAPIKRGTHVKIMPSYADEQEGICYSIPNVDPVSYIVTLLMYNVVITRVRRTKTYDIYGNVTAIKEDSLENIPLYIQRVSYNERRVDTGIKKEITLKLVVHNSVDINVGDIIISKDGKYIVDDIDDILKEDMVVAYLSIFKG